mmetsp:Transcript_24777/g.39802  ORF Transcript_24777/g.39802 Transcript_24777/m.39802 type:complete len:283 (-) Transcript_24777:341-1189(-)
MTMTLLTCVHRFEHSVKCRLVTAHFETNIPPLCHSQLVHRRLDSAYWVCTSNIYCARSPAFLCQVQTIVVHVSNDDVASTNLLAHCRCHTANRPGTGDENVLSNQIEGKCRVYSVTKSIHERSSIISDLRVIEWENVSCREGDVFSKGSWAVDAYADSVRAQMLTSSLAISAMSACYVAFPSYSHTRLDASHFFTNFVHDANVFMANSHGGWDIASGPSIPIVNVYIRATNSRFCDLDQDVIWAYCRLWYIRHPEPFCSLFLNKCLHVRSPKYWIFNLGFRR